MGAFSVKWEKFVEWKDLQNTVQEEEVLYITIMF